jgi:rhamnosyltransferase subunit B
MGDILARVGLDRPGALAAMIRGWDAILAAAKPDLVVAEFAPALLMAARGRMLTVVNGTGFSCPHAGLSAFPVLGDAVAPIVDEGALLDTVDADLRSVGREPLASLPALFAADHVMIAGFAALDPYAAERPGAHCAPNINVPPLPTSPAQGDELFVYFYSLVSPDAPLWQGLADAGRRVRIHFSDASADHLATFKRLGLAFERHPLPFDRIAGQSRLALSHGGHGFVSSCLVAGLPQIIGWYDLEKKLHADGVVAAGLGHGFNLHTSRTPEIAALINAAWDDADLAARCRNASKGFVAAMADRVEDRIAALV